MTNEKQAILDNLSNFERLSLKENIVQSIEQKFAINWLQRDIIDAKRLLIAIESGDIIATKLHSDIYVPFLDEFIEDSLK